MNNKQEVIFIEQCLYVVLGLSANRIIMNNRSAKQDYGASIIAEALKYINGNGFNSDFEDIIY